MNEPETGRLTKALQSAPLVIIGAPTILESAIVLARFVGSESPKIVSELLAACGAETVAFTSDHSLVAFEAFSRFGKGRHPAALNFGDCMTYAIAKIAEVPLLFVGSDFSQTDIQAAS